jgi:hypothetical protein
MLRTHIAAAIGCARANALDGIIRQIWQGHGSGALCDEDASHLSALAHERRLALQGRPQRVLGGLVLPAGAPRTDVSLSPLARAPAPVRRHSHFKGRAEGRVWRPTNRQETQKILLAAKRYELAERQRGERSGPLGAVALEVLEYFVNLVDFRTGRLEPSLDTIMLKVRRSRDAVVRGLKALREHGFLDWLRRYEPTGHEGRGPQVRQVSNAYRLSLPQKALRLLERFGKAPPLPDDEIQARNDRAAALAAQRAGLSFEDRLTLDLGDTMLAKALSGLGQLVGKRESARQTESQSLYLSYGKTRENGPLPAS